MFTVVLQDSQQTLAVEFSNWVGVHAVLLVMTGDKLVDLV